MSTLSIVLLVILVVLIIACVVLYFLGKKAEKKQAEQQEQLDAVAQTVSMLIIDKGKMKLKDSGLPQIVIDNTPKYLRRSKVPVVKAKVGPRIMTLMCDAQIYPLIPVKKEVKATVSGIYITGVKGVRGALETPEKKKGFFARFKKENPKKEAVFHSPFFILIFYPSYSFASIRMRISQSAALSPLISREYLT